MKTYILIFTFFAFSIFNLPIQAVTSHKDKMLRDLDIIKSTFEAKYAPFEWKKDYAGWSLDQEIDLAKAKIESSNALTVHDYQKILHTFFISTRDYHVSNEYYSTEVALLPFSVKSAHGHYYITDASNNYLKEMLALGLYRGPQLPSIGDELLTFDGKSIDNVIEQLKTDELGNPTSKTSQVLAEGVLTQRLRALGHAVPRGTVEMSFKKASGEIIQAEIEWVYAPEKITNKNLFPFGMMAAGNLMMLNMDVLESPQITDSLPAPIPDRYKTTVINPIANALLKDRSKVYESFFEKAAKNKTVSQDASNDLEAVVNPPSLERGLLTLGQKIWQDSSSSHFKAYIYLSPISQKRVGYVRISTYQPTDNINNITTFAMQLASILRYFDKNTEALVIDQVDNPGGFFLYAYAILSMLTDRPLQALKHQITITQEDVAAALTDIEEITLELQTSGNDSVMLGYPVNQEFLFSQLAYSEFIISQWEAGKTLSDNFPVHGIETIHSNPQVRYRKPIVILVDSRDFSCADVVPAILQDNARALVFGEQTAGAGGVVKRHSYPNLFGLASFSYTASIFERVNGARLENLGVTPDVPYELTEDDLLHGYRGYIQAVNAAVESEL